MKKFRKKLVPIDLVPETAQERIQELKESGSFEFDPFSMGAWSHSKYKTLDRCPLKFLLDYILNVGVIDDRDLTDDTVLRHVGTAAHTILELCREGHSVDEAYDKAREMHFEEVTEKYWPWVDNLKFNIQEFLMRLRQFEARHPVKVAHTELKLAVDREWKPVEFFSPDAFFRGVVDLPLFLENGDLIVIDHKHGGSAQFGLRNYQDQLDTYTALVYHGLQKCKGATSGIHFIKEGDILLGNRVSENYLEEMPKKINVYISAAIDYVKMQEKFAHSRNNLCKYCEHQPICHGGKRGTANELQPVIEMSEELLK